MRRIYVGVMTIIWSHSSFWFSSSYLCFAAIFIIADSVQFCCCCFLKYEMDPATNSSSSFNHSISWALCLRRKRLISKDLQLSIKCIQIFFKLFFKMPCTYRAFVFVLLPIVWRIFPMTPNRIIVTNE